MDVESIKRWEDYSRAKDEMFVHTDIPEAPWFVVEADDKRRARINMIAHLLTTLALRRVVEPTPIKLPKRPPSTGYERPGKEHFTTSPTTPPRWAEPLPRRVCTSVRSRNVECALTSQPDADCPAEPAD